MVSKSRIYNKDVNVLLYLYSSWNIWTLKSTQWAARKPDDHLMTTIWQTFSSSETDSRERTLLSPAMNTSISWQRSSRDAEDYPGPARITWAANSNKQIGAVTWSLRWPTATSPETRHECAPLPEEHPCQEWQPHRYQPRLQYQHQDHQRHPWLQTPYPGGSRTWDIRL